MKRHTLRCRADGAMRVKRFGGEALVDAMAEAEAKAKAGREGRVDFEPLEPPHPLLVAAGSSGATAAVLWGALALMAQEDEERRQQAEKESQLPLQGNGVVL